MKKYLLSSLVFFLLLNLNIVSTFIFFSNDVAQAQGTNLPVLYEPIYPDNHNRRTVGYFDLSVKEGDQQTLHVKVTNQTEEEVTVYMNLANAYTSPQGGMMYEKSVDSPNTLLLDDAIKMADYMNIAESMTIPPLSTEEVPIDIKVPQTKAQTMLGGILFMTKGKQTEEQQEAKEGYANFVLNIESVYAMAVQLNLPNEVPSDFILGDAGFIAEKAQVFLEMTNNAQNIQENITGTYKVVNEEETELFSGEFGPFKMAPKTKIRFPFQWGYETLEDGTYTLMIDGVAGDEKISISKEFSINNKDINDYIEKTQPDLPRAEAENGIPVWVWIVGAILFGMIMFLFGRRKK